MRVWCGGSWGHDAIMPRAGSIRCCAFHDCNKRSDKKRSFGHVYPVVPSVVQRQPHLFKIEHDGVLCNQHGYKLAAMSDAGWTVMPSTPLRGKHTDTPDLAADDKQVLRLIEHQRVTSPATSYDVLLLDLGLEPMDGFDCLRRVRADEAASAKEKAKGVSAGGGGGGGSGTASDSGSGSGGALFVAVQTANAHASAQQQCRQLVADEFVTKPLSSKKVKRTHILIYYRSAVIPGWCRRHTYLYCGCGDCRQRRLCSNVGLGRSFPVDFPPLLPVLSYVHSQIQIDSLLATVTSSSLCLSPVQLVPAVFPCPLRSSINHRIH